MSPWAILDTPPYDVPQSTCAACDYYIIASPDGAALYTPSVWDGEPSEYDDRLRIVPACDLLLIINEAGDLMTVGMEG